eukprot:CAMPEP_0175984096 /NCGR_PEP_ID=MMETSP0108-20121206/48824_1 /TAXON_ID=195067 ORGANISM="Goniomonas pacifica, Strain CCMP1869" /NCGR_SAMPLE_ID=MMETSP0108 /ASSEMBLY_ACC=CAM_ASM_000204 /LENGTH=174 /DNA_ID=CAMNT_0017314945 /DNA_START=9 /DNA_END=529 /DNA_ORIENTATION=+
MSAKILSRLLRESAVALFQNNDDGDGGDDGDEPQGKEEFASLDEAVARSEALAEESRKAADKIMADDDGSERETGMFGALRGIRQFEGRQYQGQNSKSGSRGIAEEWAEKTAGKRRRVARTVRIQGMEVLCWSVRDEEREKTVAMAAAAKTNSGRKWRRHTKCLQCHRHVKPTP